MNLITNKLHMHALHDRLSTYKLLKTSLGEAIFSCQWKSVEPQAMNILTILAIILPAVAGFSSKGIYPESLKFPIPSEDKAGKPLFLTPYIQKGKIDEARELARVTNLTSVVSYSGFLTVNAEYNSNLFFWFFPAAYNPESSPLLLWLQGGPGVSSLLGLFNENGPFVIDAENNVNFRETSWTFTHSVLYIDNPVGTGFSFTANDNGYARNQTDIARDLYSAIIQFFLLFPEYASNEFYLTGESYAGKYVPALAYKIHTENQGKPPFKVNLRGMAIGDGFCDPISMISYGDYLYNIGLLDYNSKIYFERQENLTRELIRAERYLDAFHVMDKLLDGWNTEPSYYTEQTGFKRYYNYLLSVQPPDMQYYSEFVQLDYVRRSIHVGNLSYSDENLKGKVELYLQPDIYKSVKPWIEILLNATESYDVLMYSGQLDIIVAYTLTDNFIRNLNWKGATEFAFAPRKIWRVGQQIAGYSKTVGSFTQLFVRNAGHIVPYDQPVWSFDMISRLTSGKSF